MYIATKNINCENVEKSSDLQIGKVVDDNSDNKLRKSIFSFLKDNNKSYNDIINAEIKMINKVLLSIFIIGSFWGCSTFPKSCKGVMGNKSYLSKNSNSEEYKGVAKEVYLYAQMSQNTYMEEDSFILPSYIKLAETVDKSYGFQANIYEIYKTKKHETLQEIVIAYRGTESLLDWLYGNIGSTQYNLADELYDEVRNKYDQVKITTTGHSLGGGLALHTSVVEDDVEAFVFNPSYRIHRNGKEKDNKRIVIAETGDILKIKRFFWKNPKSYYLGHFYCTKVNNHSMYLLARCVTHVAAIDGDENIVNSIIKNPSRQCGDKE